MGKRGYWRLSFQGNRVGRRDNENETSMTMCDASVSFGWDVSVGSPWPRWTSSSFAAPCAARFCQNSVCLSKRNSYSYT
jgi:hypothetical protein